MKKIKFLNLKIIFYNVVNLKINQKYMLTFQHKIKHKTMRK